MLVHNAIKFIKRFYLLFIITAKYPYFINEKTEALERWWVTQLYLWIFYFWSYAFSFDHIYIAPFYLFCQILYSLVLYCPCPFYWFGYRNFELCSSIWILETVKHDVFSQVCILPDKYLNLRENIQFLEKAFIILLAHWLIFSKMKFCVLNPLISFVKSPFDFSYIPSDLFSLFSRAKTAVILQQIFYHVISTFFSLESFNLLSLENSPECLA